MEAAVRVHAPDLIACPFLKTLIPESIWERCCCLIVHPGPRGDRGPSSLDWAIEMEKSDWGVTVLQATGEVDAGEVWASRTFSMRNATESSPYGNEVRRGAIAAIRDPLDRLALAGGARSGRGHVVSIARASCLPLMTQEVRAIDWKSRPYGARATEDTCRRRVPRRARHDRRQVLSPLRGPSRTDARWPSGRPGGTAKQRDLPSHGRRAVWITHLKREGSATDRHFKPPAARALARAGIELDLPEIEVSLTPSFPRETPTASSPTTSTLEWDTYVSLSTTAR